ncbi:hypothetical protein IMZ48_00420 [Candidatus Bathyarchaeota archaeon]|nr:hypothetical protein [Candidatus Bathyarchaeota archaeon]
MSKRRPPPDENHRANETPVAQARERAIAFHPAQSQPPFSLLASPDPSEHRPPSTASPLPSQGSPRKPPTMGLITEMTAVVAPFFIVMSPIISYSDQAVSMRRNKTSAGFSLDIPLIMLVASLLKFAAPARPPSPPLPPLPRRIRELEDQTRAS